MHRLGTSDNVAQILLEFLQLLHELADLIGGRYLRDHGNARRLRLRSGIRELREIGVGGWNDHRVHHLAHGMELDEHVLHVALDANVIA